MKRSLTCLAAMCAIGLLPMFSRAADVTPEQMTAATDLLQTMHMDTVLSEAISTNLDMQIQQNPQIARFKPIMVDFFKKYMSWDSLKDDLARMYSEEFTADELKQLTAFYKSPLGQKVATKQSLLMSKGQALGQQRVQEHMAELQQAIRDDIAKNPPANAAPGQ